MVATVKMSDFMLANLATTTNYSVGVSSTSGGFNYKTPRVTSWTTAGRPTPPFAGLLGFNASTAAYEYYDGSTWTQVGSGLNPIVGAKAASTVNLNATYANGASGVGATLTNAGAMAAFAIDGYTAALNDRILIKNQTATLQNGIYVVTTLGSGAANWVLTRASDYNAPAEINVGDLVGVISGGQAGSSWYQTATVTAVGTDPIVFVAFFSPGSYANSGVNTNITSMTGLTGYLQAPTGIKDANGNIALAFNGVASAVNYISSYNGATGNAPSFLASGSDAAVAFLFQSKGGLFRLLDATATSGATLEFRNAANTNYTQLKCANAQATNATFILPGVVASGFMVSSSGGILSIANNATSIAGSVAVTGFSGTPTLVIRSLVVGKMVFVSFSITGTSNATTFTLTGLPNAAFDNNFFPILVTDNSVNTFGLAVVTGTTITFYPNGGTNPNNWTNSGTKSAYGTFWYEST